jgi:acyl-CoA thioesterase-1
MNSDSALTKLAPFWRKLGAGVRATIAGLGDSLTYGWMVRRGFFDRGLDALEERFSAASLERVNAGVPGDTARGGLARLDRVLSRSPDVVVVQFALNDAFAGFSPAEFSQSLRAIAARAVEQDSVPVLATSSPLLVAAEQQLADSFYGAIRAIGRELDVPLADLERHWLATRDPALPPDELFQADGVHPTDEGHQLMADGLVELLSSPPP